MVWAVVRKDHKLCGLNKPYLFLTVLEAEKSQIKAPADLLSDENPLPVLEMAFSLCPHCGEIIGSLVLPLALIPS